MSSIITNRSALLALQSVNAAGRDLANVQNRISTGLKVGGARDNAAVFGMAQGLRADIHGESAAGQSLARARSALDVTHAAIGTINDLLVELKSLATAYSDRSLGEPARAAIRANMEALIGQADRQAKVASFDGLNFISGVGVEGTVYSTASYALPASLDTPQSFLTPMAAGASAGVTRTLRTTTGYSVPHSSLTPDTFTAALNDLKAVTGNAQTTLSRQIIPAGATLTADRSSNFAWPDYATAGRVDVWVDAFTDPNSFEVWHGGQKVAASGQPYVAGATAIGAANPVTGQVMLSFDYSPGAGRSFEIRTAGGGSWAFEPGSEAGPSSAPASAPTSHQTTVVTRSDSALSADNLRPETAGTPTPGAGVKTVSVNAGATAGRVDLLFEGYETPDVVEIWQNGTLVAATGRAYAPGGGAVGAGLPVTGQSVLSFDYIPAAGQTLEFRFNPGNPQPNAGWSVGGLELYPTGSPQIASGFTTSITQSVRTSTYRETNGAFGSDLDVLTPETEALGSASATYTLTAGSKPGRVDLWVDAYADADVVEVYQNGVLVGASGRPYVAGPGPKAPALPVQDNAFISFDYDPANGQTLEFRFNNGIDATGGAWTVGGLVLQDGSAPLPAALGLNANVNNLPGEIFPDQSFIRTGAGDPHVVQSRNMTAAGLRLTGLDWADPVDLLDRIGQAIDRATSAASYFGSQDKLLGALLAQNSRRMDALQTGVGNLVDADLAKDSARLQAAQVRQQLATQTLSIANRDPQWMLSLFRGS